MSKNVRRCIVLNCTNHTDEGEFVGELCSPCHSFIAEGLRGNSQAYRNAVEAVHSAAMLVGQGGPIPHPVLLVRHQLLDVREDLFDDEKT